ncbi:MAG: type II secretion system minor pseudopilin GspH [Gammaproteobacteria bacterium]|nr:type II secretion system minor pseudopilin GspH [Gammaproteobacteria bacterium]
MQSHLNPVINRFTTESVPASQHGFTLIELLVVIFIVSLMSGMAVLGMGTWGGDSALDEEAQRLRQLIELASQEAILQGRPIGLELDSGSYRFLQLGKKSWKPYADKSVFHPRSLPSEWRLELRVANANAPTSNQRTGDQQGSDEEPPLQPQIIFYSTGESESYDLLFIDPEGDIGFQIKVSGNGQTTLAGAESE